VPGVAFSRAYESATYQTGRVGGDFVDIFGVGRDLVGITLGDVSGKGLDAAVSTSTIRTTLRVHAVDGLSPASIASKANEVMQRFTETESFVTLWFGLLNTMTGQLRYICAGHPPALVVSKHGDIRELECRDPILGAFEGAAYFECQAVLVEGDRLIVYSDGVTEARASGGKFLDTDGLFELVFRNSDRPTSKLAGSIMKGIVSYSEGVLRDDAAVLVVEATGLATPSPKR
jgi:serine phosphatase RsbU (regulator of sigma subunit)